MSRPRQGQQITVSVSKLVAKDEAEVAKFWDICFPGLRALFLRMLRPMNITLEDAEELAVDTMKAIHKKLSGFGNMTSDQLLNYVFQSGINLAYHYTKNECRRRNTFEPLSEDTPQPIQPDPSKRIVEHIAIKEALSKLSEKEGKVFNLMYVEGYSIKETASRTGLSEDNVKQLGSRSKRKLAAELSKQITP